MISEPVVLEVLPHDKGHAQAEEQDRALDQVCTVKAIAVVRRHAHWARVVAALRRPSNTGAQLRGPRTQTSSRTSSAAAPCSAAKPSLRIRCRLSINGDHVSRLKEDLKPTLHFVRTVGVVIERPFV